MRKVYLTVGMILLSALGAQPTFATHAVGADLTYQCTGNPNEYLITLSFYRDCGGVNAPGSVTIDFDNTCNGIGNDQSVTLFPIPGTGQEVTPICPTQQTTCNGGPNPGIEEWVFQGTITLNGVCNNWIASYNICCRNGLLTNVATPTNYSMAVQAHIDNTINPCNNSPYFTNPPIPFVCIGQTYCFNHGAIDPDGDSLVYTLIDPMDANGPVPYNAPFTAQQPLSSNPPVTFNPATGDICMTPTNLESTIVAMLVEEYRNGVLIGSVVRDIQINVINCTNTIPSITGFDGNPPNGNNTDTTVCAGTALTLNMNSFDPDVGHIVTMTWNGGVPGATFTTAGNPHPTGTLTWTPTANHISNVPYCFTVTVQDDNCPYMGSFTQSYCITVEGIDYTITTTGEDCFGNCNGSASVVINNSTGPVTYNWSNSQITANISGLCQGNYNVTLTDGGSCPANAIAVVAGPTAPLASTTAVTSNYNGQDVSCYLSNNGSALVTPSGGTPPYTFQWDPQANNQVTATATGLMAGNYQVTVYDANGCIANNSATLTQPTAISATATVISNYNGADVSCFGATDGTITSTVGGGTPGYTYQWNAAANNQTTPTATGVGLGLYYMTVTDINGCTVVAQTTVSQPLPLTTSFGAYDGLCFGSCDGYAVSIPNGGTGNYTYTWSPNPGAGQGTPNASQLCAGSYVLQVTDVNGCQVDTTFSISTPATIAYTTNSTFAHCGQADGTATLNSVNGGTPPFNYQWDANAGFQAGATATGLATGQYCFTITDANGCAKTGCMSVPNAPAPYASVLGTPVTCDYSCDGQAIVSVANGTPPFTYLWNDPLAQTTATATGLCEGFYNVTVTDNAGCIHNVQVLITQPSPINVTVSPDTAICQNGTGYINASAIGGNGGPFTYNWDNNLPSLPQHLVQPNTNTCYNVSVTDPIGCQAVTQQVCVNLFAPVQVGATNDMTICEGDSINMQANASNGNGTYNYQWNTGATTAGLGATPYSYPSPSVYFVTVTDGCNTWATDTVVVDFHPTPSVSFTTDNTTGCQPFIVTLSSNAPTAVDCYWNFGNGSFSNDCGTVTYTYTEPGTYQPTLLVTSAQGCKNDFQQPWVITVNPTPRAEFLTEPNTTTIMDPTFEFTDLSLGGVVQWSYTFFDPEGNVLGNSNVQDPAFEFPGDTGLYMVLQTVTNGYGCTNDSLKYVRIMDFFNYWIPNAFTPDGDGSNDFFFGKGAGVEDVELLIFDRWGEKIHEESGVAARWDGTYKGEDVPDGVYVYMIQVSDFQNGKYEYNGHVTVVR